MAMMASYRWCAPEVGTSKMIDTKAADVFSFGIILWELCTRQVPFADVRFDSQVERTLRSGCRPPLPSKGILPRYRALIERCWHQNPIMRYVLLYLVYAEVETLLTCVSHVGVGRHSLRC